MTRLSTGRKRSANLTSRPGDACPAGVQRSTDPSFDAAASVLHPADFEVNMCSKWARARPSQVSGQLFWSACRAATQILSALVASPNRHQVCAWSLMLRRPSSEWRVP